MSYCYRIEISPHKLIFYIYYSLPRNKLASLDESLSMGHCQWASINEQLSMGYCQWMGHCHWAIVIWSDSTSQKPLSMNHYRRATVDEPLSMNHYRRATVDEPLSMGHCRRANLNERSLIGHTLFRPRIIY